MSAEQIRRYSRELILLSTSCCWLPRGRASAGYVKRLCFPHCSFTLNKSWCHVMSSNSLFSFSPDDHMATEAQVTACTLRLDLCNYTFPFPRSKLTLFFQNTTRVYLSKKTKNLNLFAYAKFNRLLRSRASCVFVVTVCVWKLKVDADNMFKIVFDFKTLKPLYFSFACFVFLEYQVDSGAKINKQSWTIWKPAYHIFSNCTV